VLDTALKTVARFLSRYRVTVGFVVVFVLWTLLLRAHYGLDGGERAVDELGFGLPALEEGRLWTLLTGIPFADSLGLVPQWQTVLGLALFERVAGHWRTVVVFLVGHVTAVLVVSAVLWPLRHVDQAWLHAMATTVDNGSSIGGFAVIGAWTASLSAPWRRYWRVALSCYFPGLTLLSGHIYDITHPVGWATGVFLGSRMLADRHDPTPLTARQQWLGTSIAVVIGVAAGIYFGWTGGGDGGPFGWGPGHVS
jgi:phosphatidylglycerol lysyltransferase